MSKQEKISPDESMKKVEGEKKKLGERCAKEGFDKLTDEDLYWSFLWGFIPKERLTDWFKEIQKREMTKSIGDNKFIIEYKTGLATFSLSKEVKP